MHIALDRLVSSPYAPKDYRPRPSPTTVEAIRNGQLADLAVTVRQTSHTSYEVLTMPELVEAARRAGLTSIQATLATNIDDDAARTITAIHYAMTSARPDPITEAHAYHERLTSCAEHSNRPLSLLATLTGRSSSYLSNAMRLLQLPPPVQDLVANRTLGVRHARALLRLPTSRAQTALAHRITKTRMSAQATELAVQQALDHTQHRSTTPVPDYSRRDPDIIALENELTDLLGSPTRVDPDAATLTIHYHNLDVLTGILDKLRSTRPATLQDDRWPSQFD